MCAKRGWRGWVCLGPLLCACPCPRCRPPWAGCRQAALSRPPSRTLHFSVWCETVAVINLTGALRAEDTARLGSLHQRVGAAAPSPSPLSPSTPIHPAGSAAQHPRLWSSSKDSSCFARDVSLPRAPCLVLGPSLSRHFPRFLPLPCFVCSQSVSFVSVFAKTIRSLPLAAVSPPVPPLYP